MLCTHTDLRNGRLNVIKRSQRRFQRYTESIRLQNVINSIAERSQFDGRTESIRLPNGINSIAERNQL
jgi:hypothetical protein